MSGVLDVNVKMSVGGIIVAGQCLISSLHSILFKILGHGRVYNALGVILTNVQRLLYQSHCSIRYIGTGDNEVTSEWLCAPRLFVRVFGKFVQSD